MELKTIISSEKNNHHSAINIDLIVKGQNIGSIELMLMNDMADMDTKTDEYLLKYYRDNDHDPFIITQGNL